MSLDPLQKAMRADVQRCANGAISLLHLIDELRDEGIHTVPRMKAGAGIITLRFERGEAILSRSQAGVKLEGPLFYSVTHHDPVLRYMEHAYERGEPQERILNEAAELAIPVQTENASSAPTTQIFGVLQRVVGYGEDCPDELLRRLTLGYDAWCDLDEDGLRNALDDDVIPEIDALEDDHRMAALRWACRIETVASAGYGIKNPQEIALCRQQAILRHIGKLPEPSTQAMEL